MNIFSQKILIWLLWVALGLLIVLAFWPRLDLVTSSLFYRPTSHFYMENWPVFLAIHKIGTKGAWVLGIFLIGALAIALIRRQPFFGIDQKGWLFLLLGLLIGPCLIANLMLKDHWGRARPHEITEFGGHAGFSPYFAPQPQAKRNGSFVAGDPSFGFFLPSFFYVIRDKRRAKLAFWTGMGIGMLMAIARLVMGSHFLSDILCAGLFMLLASAALHAIMYGPRATRDCWQQRLGLNLTGHS